MRAFLLFILLGCLVVGCHSQDKTLKVAATAVPHADILEAVKADLENQGIHLKIVEVDDYNLPNRLLFEKQVDANFFQHVPFLEMQNSQFGYDLVVLTKVHIEPLGLYSQKIPNLESLKDGSLIAIPCDPANESRALKLLQELGLIKLDGDSQYATIHDILENPRKLKIEEVDAAFLPRILPDVEIAIIPANFALQAKLNPLQDALALESPDSPYANVLVIRREDQNREEFQKLKSALNSDKIRDFLEKKYKGAIIPAF